MINEYLFLSDEKRNEIKKICKKNISFSFYNIENTSIWIARFSLKGNGFEEAKKLSEIHTNLLNISPNLQVLSCGSSEYFNKVLYPKINKLERNLRKLLYISSSMYESEKSIQDIKELEYKDFGTIFDLLFIDRDFISQVKKRVNADSKSEFNGMDRFTKDEIVEYIRSSNENTVWNKLFGDDVVPTLRKRFREVKTFRNDVMHAHNIDKTTYGKAEYLFDKINYELDLAISQFIKDIEDGSISEEISPKYSQTLTEAIATFKLENLNELVKQNTVLQSNISVLKQAEIISQNLYINELQKAFDLISELSKSVVPLSEYKNQIDSFTEVQKALTPEYLDELKKLVNSVTDLSKINQSPTLSDLCK